MEANVPELMPLAVDDVAATGARDPDDAGDGGRFPVESADDEGGELLVAQVPVEFIAHADGKGQAEQDRAAVICLTGRLGVLPISLDQFRRADRDRLLWRWCRTPGQQDGEQE